MNRLFKPAIALLNRLSYPQKFGLISLLFILPLGLMLFLFYADLQKGSDTTQKELYGTQYLRPLRKLMEHVPQEMVVARLYLSGDKSQEATLTDVRARVDADFVELANAEQSVGGQLETTAQFTLLQNQWGNLKQSLMDRSATTSDARHAECIAAIRALIGQVATESTLVLDPEYATYYTQYMLTTTLPEAQDVLGQTNLLWHTRTQAGLPQDVRTRLTILSSMIQSNTDSLKANAATALRTDPKPALTRLNDGSFRDYTLSALNFSQALNTALLTQRSLDMSSASLENSLRQTTAVNFGLWDAAVSELDGMLRQRLDGYASHRLMIGGFAGLALVVVAYLLAAFYLAVMRTVRELAAASTQMVRGEMRQTINIDAHDELGRVVASFNTVAAALVETGTSLLARQEDGAQTSAVVLARAAELKTTASGQVEHSRQQSDIVNQVTVSMQELATAAQNIADLAQVVRQSAVSVAAESAGVVATSRQMVQQSAKGTQAIVRTVETGQEGAATYARLLTTMRDLQAKNADMRLILAALSDIAAQTHLLSLNAAIEAAGAGEHGERFGVVAQEVKELAGRAATASADVVRIVSDVEATMAQSLSLAAVGYAHAQRIEEAASEAGAIIAEMRQVAGESQMQVDAIQHAARDMQHRSEMIGVATGQQSSASFSVLSSMARLDSIAGQAAEGSRTVSAAAAALEIAARRLNSTLAE